MLNKICWLWLISELSGPTWLKWFLIISLVLDVLIELLKAVVD